MKSAAIKEEKIKARVKENQEKEAAKVKDKKTKASKNKFEKNEIGIRKGTVLETIFNSLKKGASVSQILEACKKDHPDRDAEGMAKTIRLQLFRMPKEKGFTLDKEKGKGGEVTYKIGKIDPKLIQKKEKAEDDDEKPKKKKDKSEKASKKAKEEEAEEEEEEEEEETEEEEDEEDDD